MSPKRAAEAVGVTVLTVYRWMKAGKIPFTRGPGGRYLVSREWVGAERERLGVNAPVLAAEGPRVKRVRSVAPRGYISLADAEKLYQIEANRLEWLFRDGLVQSVERKGVVYLRLYDVQEMFTPRVA